MKVVLVLLVVGILIFGCSGGETNSPQPLANATTPTTPENKTLQPPPQQNAIEDEKFQVTYSLSGGLTGIYETLSITNDGSYFYAFESRASGHESSCLGAGDPTSSDVG